MKVKEESEKDGLKLNTQKTQLTRFLTKQKKKNQYSNNKTDVFLHFFLSFTYIFLTFSTLIKCINALIFLNAKVPFIFSVFEKLKLSPNVSLQ